MPEAQRAPSPEALADLKALVRDHGVNAELIKSLTASKEEARAHLGFLKRMMFVSNGAVMMVGALLAIFAGQQLTRPARCGVTLLQHYQNTEFGLHAQSRRVD